MDLSSLKTIKEILTKYETKPFKGMGQNFLVNRRVLEKIIKTADLKAEDTILEVGPGIGTLTQELAKNAGKIIAVEKDQKMCEILKHTLDDSTSECKKSAIADFLHQPNNVKIIHDDILSCHSRESGNPECLHEPWIPGQARNDTGKYKLVANIPYYLTSPLIRKFLETKYPPELMVLMVQKEVAQRICASPPNMSILAVSVQFYAKAKIISYVKKENFWPKPKVDSAIIKIVPRRPTSGGLTSRQIVGSPTSHNLFFKIVKAGFSQPRKQLVNNLTGLKLPKDIKLTKPQIVSWLLKNRIKPTQRAETLSVDDWINLTNSFQ